MFTAGHGKYIFFLNKTAFVYLRALNKKRGGQNCRDSPVQSSRKCDCKPNECQACDNHVNQVQNVLVHSMPKG